MVNLTLNAYWDEDEVKEREDNRLRNALVIFFYAILVLVSYFGNILVIKVACSIILKKKGIATHTLIANLAFSDLITTTFNIPFNVTRFLSCHWPFGKLLCVLAPFIKISCIYVSVITMIEIAVYRWWSVRNARNIRGLIITHF